MAYGRGGLLTRTAPTTYQQYQPKQVQAYLDPKQLKVYEDLVKKSKGKRTSQEALAGLGALRAVAQQKATAEYEDYLSRNLRRPGRKQTTQQSVLQADTRYTLPQGEYSTTPAGGLKYSFTGSYYGVPTAYTGLVGEPIRDVMGTERNLLVTSQILGRRKQGFGGYGFGGGYGVGSAIGGSASYY